MNEIDESGNVAHYAPLHHLANILNDQKIKLSFVKNLSDPRESSLGWVETVGIGESATGWKQAKAIKTDIGSQLKIFCTADEQKRPDGADKIETSIYGRPRMWSQYADYSKGFCMVLDKEQLTKEMKSIVKKPEHLLTEKVDYYDWLHAVGGGACIEYGDDIDLSKLDVFNKINENRMLKSIFFKKSIDWIGEQERRWLVFHEDKKEILISIKSSIKAVVLGSEFPINQISQAKMYCKGLGCPCYMLDYQHPQYTLKKVAT